MNNQTSDELLRHLEHKYCIESDYTEDGMHPVEQALDRLSGVLAQSMRDRYRLINEAKERLDVLESKMKALERNAGSLSDMLTSRLSR